MRRMLLLVVLALGVSSCFPELPDRRVITNLRVVAIQADPAVAVTNTFPAPVITVRALVVHPTNEDLDGVEHTWGLELGDEDFEGKEALEALVPEGPWGTEIVVDLAALFEAREGGWVPVTLPVGYSAEDDEMLREAVKLVPFLLPDIAAPGDDDDSAEPEAPIPFEETELYNENPSITAIEIIEGTRWTAADGQLPGLAEALDVGETSFDDGGLHFAVEYTDDEDLGDVKVDLYWTSGTPGLPPEESDDDFGFGGGGGGGGGFGNRFGGEKDDEEVGDGQLVREEAAGGRIELGWTPPAEDDTDAPEPRLFVVLIDGQGGQTWQELRPR